MLSIDDLRDLHQLGHGETWCTRSPRGELMQYQSDHQEEGVQFRW